jgi:hypothetical protein
MKLHTAILLTALLTAFCYIADARKVMLNSPRSIKSIKAEADVTESGRWFVRPSDSLFVKKVGGQKFNVHPNRGNRSQAVIDDQAEIFDHVDDYIRAAFDAESVVIIEGDIDLVEAAEIDYVAAEINDGTFCRFYMRYNNRQCVLVAFPDENDETATATTARTNALAKLSSVSADADTSGNWLKR